MMKYLKYLRYILKHKWYVFLECCKEGIIWRGIIHDISKLLPSEFFPYANHFYGGDNDIKKGRDKSGYYKPTDTGDPAFDFAWLLHQKRNRHHWQWWVLPEDEGGIKVLEMSLDFRKEMLCDWRGAGLAIFGRENTKSWYKKNKHKMQLAPKTREWLEDKIYPKIYT